MNDSDFDLSSWSLETLDYFSCVWQLCPLPPVCCQVFFYKRAQIFVADIHGAFTGQGLGKFHDVGLLTMFADYRVPVVLQVAGVLQYSPSLDSKVQKGRACRLFPDLTQ